MFSPGPPWPTFCKARSTQCTEVRFASLLFGGFTTMAVINPPEKKLTNRTSVQWRPHHRHATAATTALYYAKFKVLDLRTVKLVCHQLWNFMDHVSKAETR